MGKLDAAKILVAEGANMEAERLGGQTPLWAACQHGRASVIRMLLKARAHIDARDDLGMTPLATACHWGRPRAVRLLLAAGAKKELADRFGTTPLGTACRCGQLHLVRMLLEAAANAAARDNLGRSCLQLASGSHGLAIRYLISTHKWSRRLQKKATKDSSYQFSETRTIILIQFSETPTIKILQPIKTVYSPINHILSAHTKGFSFVNIERIGGGSSFGVSSM